MKGAIVGLGNQGKRYVCAMRQLNISIVAVCDINPDAFKPKTPSERQSWQTPYPSSADFGEDNPNFYTDYQEMLEKERPEIVGVVTWTQDHAPITIEVAKMGAKGILVEKPISNSLISARQMIQACRENRTRLVIGHTRRWWQEHQEVKKRISMGEIGELRHLWLSCGGARLGDLAIHFIDWMRWITESEVDTIIGYVDPINEPNPRDPDGKLGFQDPPGTIVLVFQNGIRGLIDLSQGVALPPRFEIVGTKGRILIEEFNGEFDRWEIDVRLKSKLVGTTDYYGKIERKEFIKTGWIDWIGMIVNPLQELLSGNITCGGEDGYNALECLVATHISHEKGNIPVKLPLTNPEEFSRALLIA